MPYPLDGYGYQRLVGYTNSVSGLLCDNRFTVLPHTGNHHLEHVLKVTERLLPAFPPRRTTLRYKRWTVRVPEAVITPYTSCLSALRYPARTAVNPHHQVSVNAAHRGHTVQSRRRHPAQEARAHTEHGQCPVVLGRRGAIIC